jgi:uncharacterized protein
MSDTFDPSALSYYQRSKHYQNAVEVYKQLKEMDDPESVFMVARDRYTCVLLDPSNKEQMSVVSVNVPCYDAACFKDDNGDTRKGLQLLADECSKSMVIDADSDSFEVYPLLPRLEQVLDEYRVYGLHAEVAETNFRLSSTSLHGPMHWDNVWHLAQGIYDVTEDPDMVVVARFCAYHDCGRANDGRDPEHGHRSAELAIYDGLTKEQAEKLRFAIEKHADGLLTEDPTIGLCWDADRMDLRRVGVLPHPDYMSTKHGKSFAAYLQHHSGRPDVQAAG